jgi:hypothetical protein
LSVLRGVDAQAAIDELPPSVLTTDNRQPTGSLLSVALVVVCCRFSVVLDAQAAIDELPPSVLTTDNRQPTGSLLSVALVVVCCRFSVVLTRRRRSTNCRPPSLTTENRQQTTENRQPTTLASRNPRYLLDVPKSSAVHVSRWPRKSSE